MREFKFREWETYRKTMAVGIREDYDDSVGSREDLLDVLKDTLEAEDVIVKAIDGHIYPPAIKTAALPEI